MYTSGSTGQPKGVVVTHRNVVRLVKNADFVPLAEETRILQTGAPVFDAATFEIWGSLLNGGRLVLVGKEVILNAHRLSVVLASQRINTLWLSAPLFNQLMQENIELFAPLSYLLVGGDVLSPARINRVRSKFPDLKIINGYGPTENTTFSTTYLIEKEFEHNIPIGRPITNSTAYLYDKSNRLTPIGVVGELYVGGDGVAGGYLNNPELTAEKFSKSNRSYRTNIIYKTGDLARWLEDGNIEYLGRIDRQVKIRGFRIELEEIENKLAGHNEIEQAVVAAKTNENGDTYLCAYIISQKDIQIPRLKEYLAAYLPGYMVPLYFIKLEKMPLTAGGKVDYNALPTPGEISFNENVEYVPPSDDVEKKLAAIWQKVMDRDNIGVKEDFFTLGGDSIRAIQVISRMNSAGYKLEIKDLFKYPTIAELAPQIKKLKRIPDQSPVAGKIPLTPIQVDFFAGNYLEPHHANQAVMFYAKEGFVKETVKKIFTRIQEHHDALRMTYQSDENGGILQTGHGVNYPLSLEEYDLRNRENGLTELQVKINQIQTGIDLEKGPLMKLGLFHLEDGDRLLIVIHHLVIDGISWRILFEDIKTLYKQGTGAVLPLKSDSFAQWSKILREYADSKKFLKEKDYWAQLETITAPDIKMDYEATGNYAEDTWRESFKLGEEETSQLLTAANAAFKTEINDILLTALGLGIKKTFGQERVLIALEGHGREVISEDIDISRTVGWFTSVYPVLLDISYANDTGRQVKEIKEILRKIPGKGIGYGILKYLTQKENKSGMEFKLNPQISFNYLGQFDADVKRNAFFEIAKEYAGDELSPKNKRNFELDVSGMIIDNRLTLNITYNKNHFKPGTISALAGNFEVELRRLIAFCCARENSEPTPADFIYKGLSIETIDRLTKEYPGMEDLYTLTPMQEGMLFHTLADESAHVNLYFEQMSYRLHGELDIAVVEKSLNDLFKRHDILRTAFIHDISPRPVQVVLKDRRCDFYYKDIRDTAGNVEIEAFVSDFKAEDKLRAFDLSKDVLARISVLRTDIAEYELIWSSHHILMDGWCIGILNNEFLEIYKSHIENRPYRLPVVKVYRTYIEWLEKQDKQESQKYWQEYLAFFEEQTGLPRIYKTKKYETGYRYERFSLVLDSDVTKKLNNTAARNRVTLNNTVQTLWAILLGKYTGKEDVVFGGVVSGRPAGLAGVENMIGLFINTIPVRVQFDQTMKFNEAVRNVQEKAVAAELHHYHPLVETQSATPLKQDLLDHIIVFENYPATRLIEGYGVEQNNSPQEIALNLSNVEVFGQTNYDFNIIFNAAEQLEVIFKYNGNVYDSHFVQKIAGHFAQLINQVIQNDESKIGAFTILSQEEKTQLLHDFNVTEQDYPQDKTVPQLFEEQASRTPDHVGLLGDVGHVRPVRQVNITYRQLNEQSDNLAGLLIEKGVLVDGVVGLMVGPSLEMMVGILAILKTGNAYLPLDPEFPQERIDYMLKDSGTSILINEKFFRRSRGAILQKSPPGAANLAYVIYTSGTTGKPKGVLIENKNLVNYVYWFKKAAGLTEQDRTVLTSSYCFDLGYTVVYPSISSGCQLHIIPKESYMSPGDLLTYIVLHRVTFLKMTPSLFAVISASEEFVRLDCRELRLIVLGGEQIKPYDINRAHEIWPHITIMNHYGPTETTIGSIAQVIDFGEFEAYKKKPTIGYPIANTKLVILDKMSALSPVGVPGELCISGAGVGRGYLNCPELSAEKFSFSRTYRFYKTYIFYKTGDLARWTPQGAVEFLGRIDRQVKIRGYRVETGEIENYLLKHPGIKEAAVIQRQYPAGDSYLCAYIVWKEANEDSLSGLKEFLVGKLPGYMIPSYFVTLKRIPLTPNGKLDRNLLPEPGPNDYKNAVAPEDVVEKKLLVFWAEILVQTPPGVDCNFFEIGGHSLKATTLVTRIQKEFEVKLPVSEVFKNPTIRALSECIKKLERNKYLSIEPVEKREYYETSPGQKRLWLLSQSRESSRSFTISRPFFFTEELDISALNKTFESLIERHESLRTVFLFIADDVKQRILQPGELGFRLEYLDLRSVDNKEKAVQDLSEESENNIFFDLAKGPLLNAKLLQTEINNFIMLFTMHHIISDFLTMEVLKKEFSIIYDAHKRGASIPLKPQRIQYKDFAYWQKKQLKGLSLERLSEYWRNQFIDKVPILELPYDKERPKVQSYKGERVFFPIPVDVAQQLRTTAAENGATLFMMLYAVVDVFLYYYSGQNDIVMGIAAAGREHPDLEDQIGFFINTLAVRVKFREEAAFLELVGVVKKAILDAYAHQMYPLDRLIDELKIKKNPARQPLFDVMIGITNFQGAKPSTSLPPEPVKTDEDETSLTIYDFLTLYDLSFDFRETARTINVAIEYNTDLFERKTITRMIKRFKKLLERIVKNPAISISSLQIDEEIKIPGFASFGGR